jgi:hypothetical protein
MPGVEGNSHDLVYLSMAHPFLLWGELFSLALRMGTENPFNQMI